MIVRRHGRLQYTVLELPLSADLHHDVVILAVEDAVGPFSRVPVNSQDYCPDRRFVIADELDSNVG